MFASKNNRDAVDALVIECLTVENHRLSERLAVARLQYLGLRELLALAFDRLNDTARRVGALQEQLKGLRAELRTGREAHSQLTQELNEARRLIRQVRDQSGGRAA